MFENGINTYKKRRLVCLKTCGSDVHLKYLTMLYVNYTLKLEIKSLNQRVQWEPGGSCSRFLLWAFIVLSLPSLALLVSAISQVSVRWIGIYQLQVIDYLVWTFVHVSLNLHIV